MTYIDIAAVDINFYNIPGDLCYYVEVDFADHMYGMSDSQMTAGMFQISYLQSCPLFLRL